MDSAIRFVIPAQSILTWMGERGIISRDWQKRHEQTQARYEELIRTFPYEHEDEAFRQVGVYIKDRESFFSSDQSGLHFDYIHAKEIFRRMTETTTEGSQKFFFGGYKNPVVEQWQTFIKLYEQDGVNWAEQAKDLQHATSYGVSSLDVQIAHLWFTIADAEQKQEILASEIKDKIMEFNDACQKHGVSPDPATIEAELCKTPARLLPIFKKVEKYAKELENLAMYYLGTESGIDITRELATLRVLAQYGDVTTAVYRHLRKLNSVCGQTISEIIEGHTDLIGRETRKYDNYPTDDIKSSGQWEVIGSYGAIDVGQSEVEISEAQNDTILLNQETRHMLLSDIDELECFMRQRLSELNSQELMVISSSSKYRGECENIQYLKQKLKVLDSIRKLLTDPATLQLVQLKLNPEQAAARIRRKICKNQRFIERQREMLSELEADIKAWKQDAERAEQSRSTLEKHTQMLLKSFGQDLNQALKPAVCKITF